PLRWGESAGLSSQKMLGSGDFARPDQPCSNAARTKLGSRGQVRVTKLLRRSRDFARNRWPLRGSSGCGGREAYGRRVADEFSARYAGLVTGSYDCVDRIVLNVYYPLGYNPGGFRTWWRRLHGSDELLDDTHLMRMAGRFARRVKAWGLAGGVPVIFCK